MTEVEEFIEAFLEHADHSDYDPVKAREYYLRTRKLKGRKAAAPAAPKKVDRRSTVDYYGKPLPKLGKRFEEDQSPLSSPGGNTTVKTYDGGPHGLGRATYADGYTYDAKTGWSKPAAKAAPKAKSSTSSATKARRVSNAESNLIRARTKANKIKDPQKKQQVLTKLHSMENRLRVIQGTRKSPPRGMKE
jgi:hypothetical protein